MRIGLYMPNYEVKSENLEDFVSEIAEYVKPLVHDMVMPTNFSHPIHYPLDVYVFGYDKTKGKIRVFWLDNWESDPLFGKRTFPKVWITEITKPFLKQIGISDNETSAFFHQSLGLQVFDDLQKTEEFYEKELKRVIKEMPRVFGELVKKFPFYMAPLKMALLSKDGFEWLYK